MQALWTEMLQAQGLTIGEYRRISLGDLQTGHERANSTASELQDFGGIQIASFRSMSKGNITDFHYSESLRRREGGVSTSSSTCS